MPPVYLGVGPEAMPLTWHVQAWNREAVLAGPATLCELVAALPATAEAANILTEATWGRQVAVAGQKGVMTITLPATTGRNTAFRAAQDMAAECASQNKHNKIYVNQLRIRSGVRRAHAADCGVAMSPSPGWVGHAERGFGWEGWRGGARAI